MRRLRACLVLAAAAVAPFGRATGQSAFALCGDSVPNRIVSTGPVRAVIATVEGLRVCVAAEGFTDSAAMHPRDWANPQRLVVLETRLAGDSRQMMESRLLTSWSRNDRPLGRDSAAAEWRSVVLDLAGAKWDVAARRMERQDLESVTSGLLAQKVWMLAQIDTLRRRDDSLRVALSEGLSRAREEKQRRVTSARRYKRADLIAEAEAIVPEQAVAGIQDLIDRLDAKGRTATLRSMLTDLDADNRLTTMKAALEAIEAQPDPEERLRAAAAKLRAILAR